VAQGPPEDQDDLSTAYTTRSGTLQEIHRIRTGLSYPQKETPLRDHDGSPFSVSEHRKKPRSLYGERRLFKAFADIDAIPVCLKPRHGINHHDRENIAPTREVHLEDISLPAA
jgi:hypothetical protein